MSFGIWKMHAAATLCHLILVTCLHHLGSWDTPGEKTLRVDVKREEKECQSFDSLFSCDRCWPNPKRQLEAKGTS